MDAVFDVRPHLYTGIDSVIGVVPGNGELFTDSLHVGDTNGKRDVLPQDLLFRNLLFCEIGVLEAPLQLQFCGVDHHLVDPTVSGIRFDRG